MSEEAANLAVSAPATGDASKENADKDDEKTRRPAKSRLRRRLLWGVALSTPLLIGGLWVAVHSIPWMGPLVANGLRATIGKDNVTRLEEFVYSIEDQVNQTLKANDKPKAYWEVPPKGAPKQEAAPLPPVEELTDEGEPAKPTLEPFHLSDPGPAHKAWGAKGDGIWVPLHDPRRPEEAARMFKTLLHPDDSRSWAELFVVAVDLRTVSVMPVMGYQEPRSDKEEAKDYKRHAKIPEEHHLALLAAFNGGFMAEHGGYGVFFDGILFIDPKDDACTLAHYQDGTFEIATWSRIKDKQAQMSWFRQAPNCMYEDGKMHPQLKAHRARKWGATLDGNTVIRRSAVGLSEDQKVLYVGISNHTTAKAMGSGMHHAGAHTVAQMDVNWSYPKFVTFKEEEKVLYPVKLADGFEFSNRLYLREREMRDFFYLVRKEELPTEANKGKAVSPKEQKSEEAPQPTVDTVGP